MEEIYLTDELILKQAKLFLVNDQITVQINNATIEYKNAYTAFSFDTESNQLLAPHFRLTVNATDAKRLHVWLMDLIL